MKNNSLLVLLFLTFASIGCEKKEKILPETIAGTWIEVTEKKDTINFTKFGSRKALDLKRGYELRSGHLLPKGGMYYYFLLESNSIAINSIFSSICPVPDPACYPHYSLKLINSDTFEIANFYKNDISANEIITFSKNE